MKTNKLLIIGISIFLILILVVGYAYKTIHTPTYSLSQINQALQSRDWKKFKEYVDIVDLTQNISNRRDIYGVGQLDLDFKTWVEKLSGTYSFDSPLLKLVRLQEGKNTKFEVKDHGKLTSISIFDSEYYEYPVTLTLTFRSEGIYYKLIDIDESVVVKRMNDYQVMIQKYYEFPMRDIIQKAVKISVDGVELGCGRYIGNSCAEEILLIRRTIKNIGERPIKAVHYKMYTNVLLKVYEYYLSAGFSGEILLPGKSKKIGDTQGWKHNKYSIEKLILSKAKPESIIIELESITFEDGKELNPLWAYEDHYIGDEKRPPIQELAKFAIEKKIFNASELDWALKK